MQASENETNGSGVANVKSAARVLSVFEYFDKVRTPRTLSEISQDLGYPTSSALALLRSIHAMGYLNYDPHKKAYEPNIRFAMLGKWITDRLISGTAIMSIMEQLAQATRETVSLGIQSGLQSQHVHVIESRQALSYVPIVGTMRPLFRSAVGRVIMSLRPREEVAKAVERINALGLDEGRQYDLNTVLRDLKRVKAKGYAYSANVFIAGAAIVAVALPSSDDEASMAVAISGPATRLTEAALPGLVETIHDIVNRGGLD
jgi:IclR family transcriptional regulator, acetate operon repressor